MLKWCLEIMSSTSSAPKNHSAKRAPQKANLKSLVFGQTENMIDTAGKNKTFTHLNFQRLADEPIRDEITSFLNTLPLVLENDHFRVVHSCWHPKAIEYLRSVDVQNSHGESISLQDLDRHFARTIFHHEGREEKTIAYQLFKQNEHPLKRRFVWA